LKLGEANRKTEVEQAKLGVKTADIDRKAAQGQDSNAIKREVIAQRDRHLGYLVDKSTGELNEKALSRLGRADQTAIRYINNKIVNGGTLDEADKADIARVRQRATAEPTAAPASGRGAPSAPRGEWRTNQRTGEQKWFATQ
jgi:hypothetical protein